MDRPTISTIGHGNRSADDLLDSLRARGIRGLIDVRSHPRSRFAHFNGGPLERRLGEAGIAYHHLGASLGGKRPEGFARHMATPLFAQGIAELEALARAAPTSIMCAEREPGQCHRSFIADHLLERGWRVIHILNRDQEKGHEMNVSLHDVNSETPRQLFVYGTLQDPALLQSLLGRTVSGTPARLPGYQILRIANYNYPTLVAADDASVMGQVLSNLNQDDLKRLDDYEGTADGLYERTVVTAFDDEERPQSVFVYVAGDTLLERLGMSSS